MGEGAHPFAVVGLFRTPEELLAAVDRLKGRGLGGLEAYTPHPVHGLAQALGHGRSPLGAMVFVMGLLGALAALGFQFWISAVDYPIVTGGKAPDSWEAFVPVVFEGMVFFAAFTAGLGMLLMLNRLPFFGHPLLKSRAMGEITRDRFALALEADPELNQKAAREALAGAGAESLEVLFREEGRPLTSSLVLGAAGSIAFACAAAGICTWLCVRAWPGLPPMSRMLRQPRLNPQAPCAFFADGRGMRMPAAETVARGHLPLGPASEAEAAFLVNPLPVTEEVLARGRSAFQTRCAVCHGPLGNGQGSLTAAYGATPDNLQSKAIRGLPDGRIYWTIVNGKNAMPGQGKDLDVEERWAVVQYVRALQRSQNARREDLQ